jgi:hypothetical protein
MKIIKRLLQINLPWGKSAYLDGIESLSGLPQSGDANRFLADIHGS